MAKHPYPSRAAAVLVGLVLVCGSVAVASAPADSGKIHGMTLSTPRGSAEWGRDTIVPTLGELAELGVNWIAIHPYARIERDGTVRSWELHGEPPRWLLRPIQEAHRRGLKIFIKPHLAHWGNFSWRGDIAFDSDVQWDRFFRTYQRWIVALAAMSTGADAFAVGTELDGTIAHEASWRQVIARLRTVYQGPLTYAANWNDYDQVPFWDALDAIGIQAYFPLLDSASDQVPTQERLDASWRQIMARVHAFSERQGRIVVFTELGYNRSAKAAVEPWDYQVGGENAERLQVACLRAALRAVDNEPSVVGAFLWKWFPGNRLPRDFAMASPAVRRVIASQWARPAQH